jgi:fatty acid desaturase
VDTRITGARSAGPSHTPVPTPRRPDPLAEGYLVALTLALLACVGAALAAAWHHVAWWPAFLVLGFCVLLEMSEARVRR